MQFDFKSACSLTDILTVCAWMCQTANIKAEFFFPLNCQTTAAASFIHYSGVLLQPPISSLLHFFATRRHHVLPSASPSLLCPITQ